MRKQLLLFIGMLLMAVMPKIANAAVITYTIAGNQKLLWGTEWDPTNVNNDMTLQDDGTYKWTSSDIQTAQDLSLEFKVCEDHAWTTSYGNNGNNFTYTLKAGSGKVSITFNAETKEIAVLTDEWTESGEVTPVTYNVYIGTGANATAGITTAWGMGDDTKFTPNDDNSEFTYTLTNPGADMEFKIITNDGANTTWYECNDFALGSEGTLTSNNGSNIVLPNNSDYENYTFKVKHANDAWTLTVTGNGNGGGSTTTAVYTIAGNNTTLWGTEWDATNTANDMTLQDDGLYKWTSAEFTAEQDLSLEFKICENHGWDVNYGNADGSNYTYTLKAGSGKVSITFNAETKEIAVLTDEWTEATEVKPVTYDVYIGTDANDDLGIATAWGMGEDTKFFMDADSATYHYTIDNPGADFSFKIITFDGANTVWYECNDGFNLGEDCALSSKNGANITLPYNEGYESYNITVKHADEAWTINVEAVGTPAPQEDDLRLGTELDGWKGAGSDYKFVPNADSTEYTLSVPNPGIAFNFKVVVNGEWLGADVDTVALQTVYTLTDTGDNNNVMPQVDGDDPFIFTVTKTADAWTLEVYNAAADAISAVEAAKAGKAEEVYNLAGQRVDAAYKGIVVANGKKYIRK